MLSSLALGARNIEVKGGPLAPVPGLKVLEVDVRDGYSCLLVEYDTLAGDTVRSYLLLPDGAGTDGMRYPALVLLHDHGARFDIGKEKLVRPLPSAPDHIKRSSKQWVDDNFDGIYFGDALARSGFVIMVPEQLYWGGRSTESCQEWSRLTFSDSPPDPEGVERIKALKREVYEGQRQVYDSLAAMGVVWAERTLEEDARAARILSGLDYVDSARIGAFGWSMGAHRCWMLAAFCNEIRGGAALCWMTLKQTCPQPPSASDYSMYVPYLRDSYDFPDIARLLAPKPFLFYSGLRDKLFPKWATDRAYDRMHEIYDAAGASGMLDTEYFDGPHHCGVEVQERITDYLRILLTL